MASRRALITGAGGFVGANLTRHLLARGHEVHATVRPGGEPWRLADIRDDIAVQELDLRDGDAIARLVGDVRPEWIFHLAAHGAYSWQTDPARIVQTNLTATIALLEAAREHGFHAFVNAGSSSEYGFKDHPPSEDEPLEPNSHYAVAKAAASMWCRHAARAYDVHAVTLRLYSVYGPWEEPGRLIPRLVVLGREGRLPELADPQTARDFVYVDDVCDAFEAAALAAETPRGAIWNVGTGHQTALREVIEQARRSLGIRVEPRWGTGHQRVWDTSVWVADPSRAQSELGWRARHSLADGFAATLRWFEREAPLKRYAENETA